MAQLPIPTADIERSYVDALDTVGEPVVLRRRTGEATFDDLPAVGMVKTMRLQDLVPGGPAQLGDFVLILLKRNLPAGYRLERKDRVTVRGRDYAVVNWDDMTRGVRGHMFAVDVLLRG